jgi:hypothetical protein
MAARIARSMPPPPKGAAVEISPTVAEDRGEGNDYFRSRSGHADGTNRIGSSAADDGIAGGARLTFTSRQSNRSERIAKT